MDKKSMLELIISHYASGNKSRMARILNISPQAISTWFSRNTFDLELIYAKCENINPDWLLTGQGSMLKTDAAPPMADNDSPSDAASRPVAIPTNSPTEGIPLLPFNTLAGELMGEQSAMQYECERYVIPAFRGADFMIRITGDSMEPTYRSGDLVACQRVPLADIFFQWGKTYVLDTVQGSIIKRIKPGSDPNHVLIVSDNPAYQPYELSRQQFNGVALVRGLVRIE